MTLPPSANWGVVVGEEVSVGKEEGNEKRKRKRGVGRPRKGWRTEGEGGRKDGKSQGGEREERREKRGGARRRGKEAESIIST